ncbi:MAG: large-conductance mechanosensitive channel protein MscL [Bacteroidota bacterium]
MLKEFKAFALRGNVIDLAVGIIIGAAFGAIVQSLVKDVIMPPIGLLIGNVDFSSLFIVLKHGTTPGPYYTIDQAQKAGAVTLNIGLFINTIISFLIIAVSIFMLVKLIKYLEGREEAKPEAPALKKCPYCLSNIDPEATRCAYCTSDLRQEHA